MGWEICRRQLITPRSVVPSQHIKSRRFWNPTPRRKSRSSLDPSNCYSDLGDRTLFAEMLQTIVFCSAAGNPLQC